MGADPARRRSAQVVALFLWYNRRYLRKHFHAVRISRSGPVPALPPGPAVVVLNHPSWWDPLTAALLTQAMPGRAHFAPIDARGLAQYPFLERLGLFGIEAGTTRGGLAFLRQGLDLLSRPGTVLWVTAQGQFTDPRARPTLLKPGVGHLAHRLGTGCLLPLALEYPFWDERTPEALVRFGPALDLAIRRGPDEWTRVIAGALQDTQDVLAREAMSRDPAAFDVVLPGGAGVGGVYDLWRRFRALLGGERFRAEHGPPPSPGRI